MHRRLIETPWGLLYISGGKDSFLVVLLLSCMGDSWSGSKQHVRSVSLCGLEFSGRAKPPWCSEFARLASVDAASSVARAFCDVSYLL